MENMRYKVGDTVWVGDFSPLAAVHMTCPDCGGTGRLRVTFHDETQVSINCANCARGYEPPTGYIIVHRNEARARQAVVSGFEARSGEPVRWHYDGSRCGSYRTVDDDAVFDTEADAMAWAQKKSSEYEQEQRDRIAKKEKDSRSWAWNASYHRRCIKEAQRQVEYHTSKLNVAAIKAKEDKAA